MASHFCSLKIHVTLSLGSYMHVRIIPNIRTWLCPLLSLIDFEPFCPHTCIRLMEALFRLLFFTGCCLRSSFAIVIHFANLLRHTGPNFFPFLSTSRYNHVCLVHQSIHIYGPHCFKLLWLFELPFSANLFGGELLGMHDLMSSLQVKFHVSLVSRGFFFRSFFFD